MKKYKDTNYLVSENGEIFREHKSGMRLVRPSFHDKRKRYLSVSISHNGIKKTMKVHQIVWETYKGDRAGFEIDHVDNNSLNNKLSNLQLLTKLDNIKKEHEHRREKNAKSSRATT